MSAAGFDFGRNWQDFSNRGMGPERLEAACESLRRLLGADGLKGKTFLDIGCGSGLFSIAAARCGAARVLGTDINPTSVEVSRGNLLRFQSGGEARGVVPDFTVGDVLSSQDCARWGQFDIVYAWGVLHHTGRMWEAIRNAAALVKPEPGGLFAIAIYNRHWSSATWRMLKRMYNLSPRPVRSAWHAVFFPVIYVAKFLVTGRNPLCKERGMDFRCDLVDWLGGYPYEYARAGEIVRFVEGLGFSVAKTRTAEVPTGCNEFVCTRLRAMA